MVNDLNLRIYSKDNNTLCIESNSEQFLENISDIITSYFEDFHVE